MNLKFWGKRKPDPLYRRSLPMPWKGSRITRAYAAAKSSLLLGDLQAPDTSADAEIETNLTRLRNRSRAVARDNGHYVRYFQQLRQNVVGPQGFKLQVRAKNGSNKLDEPGNAAVEAAWKDFCKRENCTVDQKLSMRELWSVALESVARDGECFIVEHRSARFKYGYALQLLEADFCDHEYNMMKGANRREVRMGVERDTLGRPTGYIMFDGHPGDRYIRAKSGHRTRTRYDASRVIHLMKTQRPGQTRAVPWTATSIPIFQILNGYIEAELVAARVAAAKMGFFKSDDGAGYTGDDFETDANGEVGAPISNSEPGQFEQLPQGMDFVPFDPQHPTTQFEGFVKSVLRHGASSLNISYHALANDVSDANYSSLRQAALDDRDTWADTQQWMIERAAMPVFQNWIAQASLFQPDSFATTKASAVMDWRDNAAFVPRGFPWVDPEKEIKALVMELQNGLRTMSDAAASRGYDISDIFATIAEEKELAAAHGIELAFQPFGGGQTGFGPDKIATEGKGKPSA